MKSLALGIELSTQSAKAVVLDAGSGCVAGGAQINYDECFPSYKTSGGVLPHDDPSVRQTHPLMLVEALEAVIGELAGGDLPLDRIGAMKIDAMQHCTVYTRESLIDRLASRTGEANPSEHFREVFSRDRAPIWEDRSTASEIEALEQALAPHGGARAVTGNRAEMRFPAAQIMKWAKEHPEEYEETHRIFLLSAFLTSLMIGRPAPVDTGDGYGSNLNTFDILCPGWSPEAIEAVERYIGTGNLSSRLDEMTAYDAPVGSIHRYWVDRYGFSPECAVLAGTGDNPATLLGCGGQAVVSLGSSYTVNGVLPAEAALPDGEFNVFGYTPGRCMALTCFTNGSKLHDRFIREYITDGREPTLEDWKVYGERFGHERLSEDEPLMLPYLLDESAPPRSAGIVRGGFDASDAGVNIRSLHVSQAVLLKMYSGHLASARRLCVVGGGSRSRVLRQLVADAFGAETYTIRGADAAAPSGCAVAAAKALTQSGYEEAAERYVQMDPESVVQPVSTHVEVMERLVRRMREWTELK